MPSIFQKLHSTSEFICTSTPSLRFLLQDDHMCTQVVLQLAQSMFGLFSFIYIIRIISSAYEIMKTWMALLVPHCPFNNCFGDIYYWVNQGKILHDVHGIHHSALSLIVLGCNLHDRVPDKSKWWHRCSWCEAIALKLYMHTVNPIMTSCLKPFVYIKNDLMLSKSFLA